MNDAASLTRATRRQLVALIVKVSKWLPHLHAYGEDPASQWTKTQMTFARENALRLAVWVYFPQPGTLMALRKEVVSYLNIALSGQFHDFPRSRAEEDGLRLKIPVPGKWRQLSFLGVIAIYLILPVIAFGVAEQFAHIKIATPLQPILTLLYLLWAMFGLLAVSERITPEMRGLLVDGIKMFISKK
jgi:hypothetical protein